MGEIRSAAKPKPVHSLKAFASVFWLNGKYGGSEHKICCLFSASFALYKIHIVVDCQIENGLYSPSRLLSITFSWWTHKWWAVKVRGSEKSESLIVLGFWTGGNKTWTEVIPPEACHAYIQILVHYQSTTRLEFYQYSWDQCVFIQP